MINLLKSLQISVYTSQFQLRRAPPQGICEAFARLVSSGPGVGVSWRDPGPGISQPLVTPKNLSTFLKIPVCFLNFNVYLKIHNFKANRESVYKLSRFATDRI